MSFHYMNPAVKMETRYTHDRKNVLENERYLHAYQGTPVALYVEQLTHSRKTWCSCKNQLHVIGTVMEISWNGC